MADPTLSDVMAHLNRLDLQNQQQTALLTALTSGVQLIMSTADETKAAVDSLDTKVETLIGLVQPSIQTLRDQLTAAQAQIAVLQAGDAAAAATLSATVDAAAAEAAKVDQAIAALGTP